MYQPSEPPSGGALAAVVAWAMNEFTQLARLINGGWKLHRVAVSYAEPKRPADGDIVYADGTAWDPGAGAGHYGRRAGAWVKLF